MLGAALAVEFADELVDGAKSATLPVIAHSLGIGDARIGLLAAVPLLIGGLLELPAGLLRNRQAAITAGGVLFVLSLASVAFAQNFAELLVAVTLFFPASGLFVSLTQAQLMDAEPDHQAQLMARWDAAGWTGAVAGPLLVIAVLAAGGSWRAAYLALAAIAAVAWAGLLRNRPASQAGDHGEQEAHREDPEEHQDRIRLRDIRSGARAAWHWLLLLELANMLVDGLTGFIAIYLVQVAHTSTVLAGAVIAIRLGAGLAADALLIVALRGFRDLAVLRVTALAAALLYPAFLLAPQLPVKIVLLTLLSAMTATWYPLLAARLYGTVPSSVAVTLTTAAAMAAAAGPLAVGLAAAAFGLPWALAGLSVVPVALAVLLRGRE